MSFDRRKVALFWSIYPDTLDWANLNASGVERVMVPLSMAQADLAAHLADAHKRLIVRLTDEDTRHREPGAVALQLDSLKRHVAIEAVILGNEPDVAYDPHYGSPDWGNRHMNGAWSHRTRVQALLACIRAVGLTTVSPALKRSAISEDDTPQPGQVAWTEITRDVYDQCRYNGFHLYEYNWRSPVDSLRARFALQKAQEAHHCPLWCDEVGISSGTPAERMSGYLSIATMLLTHPLGERVECLTPFVSNGDGIGWPAHYLLRDPALYRMVRRFIDGEDFQ